MSETRGGERRRKPFQWSFSHHDQAVIIENENGRVQTYALSDIGSILRRLCDDFGSGFFPLANNVKHLGDRTERNGLGMTILAQRPGDVTHAQGASYLGVVLEECGYFQWNGKHRGIEWRLIDEDFTPEVLAERLSSPSTEGSVSQAMPPLVVSGPDADGVGRMALRFPAEEIRSWAARYGYPSENHIEEVVATHAREKGYLTRDDFLALCKWKSPRTASHCRKNSAQFIREVTEISFSSESEPLRIGILTLLNGVSWPTASTILHFCHRDRYPILDYRALWSLGVDEPPTVYRFDFWWEYVTQCRSLAREARVTMRVLDRALWQYSKDKQ